MTLFDKIKRWVVLNSIVTNPYKKHWSASITLDGYDYNETGKTIEAAYYALAERICNSPYMWEQLQKLTSFQSL